MSRAPLHAISATLACLLVAAACGKNGVGPTGEATLVLVADVSGTSVATVVVDVTAPDIPTALVFNIPVTNGVAAGTVVVPAGSDRTITMQAYDAGGVETHSGSTTLNIQPGTNPTITLVLQPLTGDVPITVTLGSVTVSVSPATVSLVVGDTARLTASIADWSGNAVVGTVRWATHDPGIAAVDGAGLVTAEHAGSTTVTATFQGAAGRVTVSVTP
jgi:uncharacterized protein YjdB